MDDKSSLLQKSENIARCHFELVSESDKNNKLTLMLHKPEGEYAVKPL